MLKVITTRYGQLVAKVDKSANKTEILNEDMELVATIQRITKEDVVKSINQIARFLSMKDVLEQLGISLAPGAYQLHSIDPESFTDEEETQPASAVQVPQEAPVSTEAKVEAPRAVKRGRPAGKTGAKRGRKPGQKVNRNPELSW